MKANVPKQAAGDAEVSTPAATPPLAPVPPGETQELASIRGEVGLGFYEAKVFKWSDGKFGASAGTVFPFSPHEAREVTGAKANDFAAKLLSQLTTLMVAQFGRK